jgi:hypothetical protein
MTSVLSKYVALLWAERYRGLTEERRIAGADRGTLRAGALLGRPG